MAVVICHQRVDGHVTIDAFPVPEAVDRLGRDLEPLSSIRLLQRFTGLCVDRNGRRASGQKAAVGPVEDEPLRSPAFDPDAAFVDRPVVCSTLCSTRFSGVVSPPLAQVLDVVGLQVTGPRATGRLRPEYARNRIMMVIGFLLLQKIYGFRGTKWVIRQ